MWFTPRTLFWPLLGWGFPKEYDPDIIGSWLKTLATDPAAYIPEIIGVIILAVYAWWAVNRWRRRVRSLW